jgi:two-component system chemotaxis response regulator CheB
MMRILILDDSPAFRARLKAALESDPDICVVAQARGGAQTVDLVSQLQPDLVTLDIAAPGAERFRAIEQIMAQRPTPILVLTSHGREAIVFGALAAGALDVMAKPDANGASLGPIVDRVKRLVQARPRPTLALRMPPPASDGTIAAARGAPSAPRRSPARRFVVLASSAGGPHTLMQILTRLPADLPAALLVVQHITAGFSCGLARWLEQACALPVRLAEANQVPEPGVILIAPDGANLLLGPDRRIILDARAGPALVARPAADPTLRSAATVCGANLLAVVLTGMGRDGAVGVEAVKAHGGRVVVQDRATSVVYGMPEAARPFADAELAPESIAADIVRFAHGHVV